MKLSKSDIVISSSTTVELFFDGIKAKARRLDYTNKIKKVLCEYLADMLKGDPSKVEFQKIQTISLPIVWTFNETLETAYTFTKSV